MMAKILVFSLAILITMSCSKKKNHVEAVYTDDEFNLILDTTGSTIDKDLPAGINYADYSPGVDRASSKALVYQRLGFYAVKFETVEQAKKEALRLNQYYSKNWLFDKVEGEPILEDMVLVKFHASNPKRRIQRKPVHVPPAHAPHAAPAAGGH